MLHEPAVRVWSIGREQIYTLHRFVLYNYVPLDCCFFLSLKLAFAAATAVRESTEERIGNLFNDICKHDVFISAFVFLLIMFTRLFLKRYPCRFEI